MVDLNSANEAEMSRLDWQFDAKQTWRRTSTHSRHMVWLRIFFISLAATSISLLLGHAFFQALLSESQSSTAMAEVNNVRMLNARFTGRDKQGQAFVITSASALQNPSNPELVELETPTFEDGLNGLILAREGIYDRGLGTLNLQGRVTLNDTTGNIFETNSAEVFVEDQRVVGLEPISGEGPMGMLTASSFEIFDGGDRVVLRGDVVSRIEP